VLTDARAPGLSRLLERWSQRCGFDSGQTTLAAVAERVTFESLHVLGCVDVDDPEGEPGPDGRILRITPRGRDYLADVAPAPRRESRFEENLVLSVGQGATVAQVLALVPFVEVGRVDERLNVVITPASISAALATGLQASVIRQRLEAIAPLPEPVARALVQASAVLGRAQFVATQGFLWVDDPELRELLRTRRQTADLFVNPSPPGGLLLSAGVELERVVLRCRTLGVEVVVEQDKSSSSRRGATEPESEGRRSTLRRRASGTRRKEAAPGSRRARTG
jgi:hypothetical protein